jgi:hypothetical protein
MTVVKWEVEARIYMHGLLVVAGALHKTDSDLMFIANARPRGPGPRGVGRLGEAQCDD